MYRVDLNYTDPRFRDAAVAGEVKPGTNFRSDSLAHSVLMHNGRLLQGAPREQLDSAGFCLASFSGSEREALRHVDMAATEHDEAQRSAYYRVLERLVLRTYGGTYLRAFSCVLRNSECLGVHTRAFGDSAPRGPVNDIHADFASGAPGLQQISGLARKLGLGRCRWAIVNCWRSIAAAPVQQWPLAVCDARTVARSEMLARRTPENGNLIYGAVPSERHKWYTFPDMREDEVLLFKQYDTDGGLARFTHHTAFDAPRPPAAATRHSAEVRVMCFFVDALDNADALRQQLEGGKGLLVPGSTLLSRSRL